ncbi:MAG: hypothetical protein Q4P72_05605 [Eubacteriales bacterium]|nr:hypothetical protein [Eubacteriales bacterium]
MRVEAKIFLGQRVLAIATVEAGRRDAPISQQLDACLRRVCSELDVGLPLWMSSNTHEFARHHQTQFFAGQFMETPRFDRLQIRWLEED